MGKGSGRGRGGGAGGADGPDETAPLYVPATPAEMDAARPGTITSLWAVLTQNIIGGGMLGLPGALATAGLALGSLFLVCFAGMSALGLHLLSAATKRVAGDATNVGFYAVAHRAAPSLTSLIDTAVAIKCFGVATSYLIVVGDSMPKVAASLGAAGWALDRHVWIVVAIVPAGLLSFVQNLSRLSFTARLSLGIVGFITVMGVAYAASPELNPCGLDDGCVGAVEYARFDMATTKKMTTFIFGFTCHQNIFAVTNELKEPTQARVDRVIGSAVGTALAVYLLFAGSAYLTFGGLVESDILNNYPGNRVVTAARFCFSVLVALSFPLQVHPSRKCILSLIGKVSPPPPALSVQDAAGPPGGAARFNLVTVAFLGCSLAVALSLESLGTMLAVVGATGSTLVSYILPGGIYFLVCPDGGAKRYVAAGMCLLGCFIMPTALFLIFH